MRNDVYSVGTVQFPMQPATQPVTYSPDDGATFFPCPLGPGSQPRFLDIAVDQTGDSAYGFQVDVNLPVSNVERFNAGVWDPTFAAPVSANVRNICIPGFTGEPAAPNIVLFESPNVLSLLNIATKVVTPVFTTPNFDSSMKMVYMGSGRIYALQSGQIASPPLAFESFDYGLTWSPAVAPSAILKLYGLLYHKNGILIASGTVALTPMPVAGICRSADYGVTWTLVDSYPGPGLTTNVTKTFSPDILYTGYGSQPLAKGALVRRSSDDGVTWVNSLPFHSTNQYQGCYAPDVICSGKVIYPFCFTLSVAVSQRAIDAAAGVWSPTVAGAPGGHFGDLASAIRPINPNPLPTPPTNVTAVFSVNPVALGGSTVLYTASTGDLPMTVKFYGPTGLIATHVGVVANTDSITISPVDPSDYGKYYVTWENTAGGPVASPNVFLHALTAFHFIWHYERN